MRLTTSHCKNIFVQKLHTSDWVDSAQDRCYEKSLVNATFNLRIA